MASQKEPGEETVAQASEPSFVAAPRDIDPEATVVAVKGKASPEPAARVVAVDDDPEETRLDPRPKFAAPKAADGPGQSLDDEATRIDPKSAVARPAPSPQAATPARPRSRSGPLLLVLLAIVAALSLVYVGSRRSPDRPEDLKPLREGQEPARKSTFKSLFDW
ncbi:MAG: hypothetical protein ACYC8T_13030 [Myxococcaceae bacterium]